MRAVWQKWRMRSLRMGKHKRKCYAKPEGICDGCKTNSTKCPYRHKYRDLRNSKKNKVEVGDGQ